MLDAAETSSLEDGNNTYWGKADVVVVFLALGSIGDCLPLCAIAASFRPTSGTASGSRSSPSRCRPGYDEQQAIRRAPATSTTQQLRQLQQSEAEVVGTDRAPRKDDRNFKRRREAGGTVEKLTPSPSSASASPQPPASSVVIVTHRCHCELLQGEDASALCHERLGVGFAGVKSCAGPAP